jgi:hypothetical protein
MVFLDRWAYCHDEDKAVFDAFDKNGKVKLKDKDVAKNHSFEKADPLDPCSPGAHINQTQHTESMISKHLRVTRLKAWFCHEKVITLNLFFLKNTTDQSSF